MTEQNRTPLLTCQRCLPQGRTSTDWRPDASMLEGADTPQTQAAVQALVTVLQVGSVTSVMHIFILISWDAPQTQAAVRALVLCCRWDESNLGSHLVVVQVHTVLSCVMLIFTSILQGIAIQTPAQLCCIHSRAALESADKRKHTAQCTVHSHPGVPCLHARRRSRPSAGRPAC